MAIDPDRHEVDPKTGFVVDKETKQVIGLTPAESKPVSHETDFPAWVVPHESHVVRLKRDDGEHITTPEWAEHFVNRVDGVVTVLVHNAGEEARALAAREVPKGDAPEQT